MSLSSWSASAPPLDRAVRPLGISESAGGKSAAPATAWSRRASSWEKRSRSLGVSVMAPPKSSPAAASDGVRLAGPGGGGAIAPKASPASEGPRLTGGRLLSQKPEEMRAMGSIMLGTEGGRVGRGGRVGGSVGAGAASSGAGDVQSRAAPAVGVLGSEAVVSDSVREEREASSAWCAAARMALATLAAAARRGTPRADTCGSAAAAARRFSPLWPSLARLRLREGSAGGGTTPGGGSRPDTGLWLASMKAIHCA
mmetsp:Transcript_12778/g.43266  ORF Transcript_12778/g.43266 Transcript_12778/m.43266 type:complete len:255 (-) Transcript_12778:288-1052(-)